jgi:alkaline phosphatase
MVTDGVAFSNAVRVADEMTDDSDTLIIVTADHSHVLSIAGYTKLGSKILGLCYKLDKKGNPTDELCTAADGKPYTMLGYGNGASSLLTKDDNGNYTSPKGRPTLTQEQALDPDYNQAAMIPRSSETHAAEDVAIYAKGPWAHLFQGTLEQNYIFHVMKQAFQF